MNGERSRHAVDSGFQAPVVVFCHVHCMGSRIKSATVVFFRGLYLRAMELHLASVIQMLSEKCTLIFECIY